MPREPRIADEVRSHPLPVDGDPFSELSASVSWEDVGKGRRGAVLARVDESGAVPLVRTTTRYGSPTQRFRLVHEQLAQRIQEHAALPVAFNNALIETYTNAYATMGSHCDQALDLADDSYIAVYSCYRFPEALPSRKLIIEPKQPGGDTFEIPLTHNTVVTFSVDSNRRLRHRIVLDTSVRTPDNLWLGVTFRTSKTSVRYCDEHAYLPGGACLLPADEEQQREFYRLRRRENHETDFRYPQLTYTISESDLVPPAAPAAER